MVHEDLKLKAKLIMELALKLQSINPMYKNLDFKDKIFLSAKICEMEHLNDIYIMLAEIDQSIIDGYRQVNYFTNEN
jgi:hypothetical protein